MRYSKPHFVVCETCGRRKRFPPSAIKKGKRFCSTACYDKRGPSNPKWRGGVITSRGRRLVYAPGHPNATAFKGSHVLEHRKVAAETIGRPLTSLEVVHHINGIKDDNRPENLQVLSQAEHARIHKPRQISDEAIRRAAGLRQDGLTWNAIAIEVGFSPRTVRTYVR